MELTIVLAILAIIAAILIPTFLNTTDRARLRSDIQSTHVIHNAMELYRAERGRAVAGSTNIGTDTINMVTVLNNLYDAGYLPEMDVNDAQTDGAVWAIRTVLINSRNVTRVVLDISAVQSETIHRAANNLPDNERRYVYGINTP